MLIYFLVLLYWLVLYFLGKNTGKSRRNLFLAIFPLYLVMALKSVSVGSDTISYYHRYIDASNILNAIQMITEPGYNYLSYFFHDILGVPFFVYYAVVAAFICYILALFIKYYSDDIYLSLITYMTIGLFTMSMSGIRQMLAISICTIPLIVAKAKEQTVFSSKKHKRRFFLLGLFCVLLAATFHNSALVFLPVLFIFNLRLSKRQTILIIIIATVVSFLLRPVIVAFMTHFATNRYQQYDFNEGYAMNTLILLIPIVIGVFCVLMSRPENNEKRYNRYLSLMFIFLALQIAFNNLGLSHAQITRLGYYFLNSYIILIPYAIKKIDIWVRPAVVLTVFAMFLVYFYLGTNGGTLRIDEYKFFWQEPEYYRNDV